MPKIKSALKKYSYLVLEKAVRLRSRLSGPDSLYAGVLPHASYSPWNKDVEFLKTFARIADHTLVDQYRAYELWTLVEQSAKLEGALMEVGVWRGGTGALIAKRASMCGIPDAVYLCDTFQGVVKAGERDPFYRGGEHSDASVEVVEQLLRDLGITNARILCGVFPEDTYRFVEHERFRFCHIDVDTYDSARDILNGIWDRMVQGGIVVYDDYGFPRCEGIRGHVEEQRGKKDRLVLYNLNGHAVMVKIR